jgi:phosphopantothenoylcysteine decarboxylase / phosphopantothenate---cysteine ligase
VARILLIIGGGIAAYKSLELIRLLTGRGHGVRAILTEGGAQFVTPLSVGALTADTVYRDLFDLTDEAAMGHIRLSREADLVVVAPATADLMAKMAAGLANDLATTCLLATDKRVLIAPAMNVRMWEHRATRRNLARLREDGVAIVGPGEGAMACGEFGEGRMAEPVEIAGAIEAMLGTAHGPLAGRHALVTSGPTHEPIDPVRYIANRSSGKQGHAIAGALTEAGARVTLISGPVSIPPPRGVALVTIETAREMLAACESALPADLAVCAAAVADFRPASAAELKLKKDGNAPGPLSLVENPDILAALSKAGPRRPRLVVGFAAETHDLLEAARAKRLRKGCDWIVANDVSLSGAVEGGVMGGEVNAVTIIDAAGEESWAPMPKGEVAARLVARLVAALGRPA